MFYITMVSLIFPNSQNYIDMYLSGLFSARLNIFPDTLKTTHQDGWRSSESQRTHALSNHEFLLCPGIHDVRI